MKTKKMLAMGVATSAALLALTACSNSTSRQGGQATPATSASASPSATEAHNQADVMFAQQMIPHHQQAIEMSDVILGKQGIDGRVVELANQIKAAQGPEIQQMQSWLSQWGQPTMPMTPAMEMPGPSATPSQTPDPHHTGTSTPLETTSAMPAPSGMPGMPSQTMMPTGSMMPGMPGMDGVMGMMSPQDMAALQNAQGVEAAKLFLTQMIQHHQGAITMAQHEIDTGQYPPAIALAHSIVTSQQQEITNMQGLLGSL